MINNRAEKLKLFSRKVIRQALKLWGQTNLLGKHPLTKLEVVSKFHQKAGYAQTPSGYGLAVREVLQEALNNLKLAETNRDYQRKFWRFHAILYGQYIQRVSPDFLAGELGIARSTYNHDQAEALELLTSILREMEHKHTTGYNRSHTSDTTSALFLAPPRPPYPLIGRDTLLTSLKEALLAGRSQALIGLPGVGKTALAIRIANDEDILAHFTDGILWARLGRNANMVSVLERWAAALGLPTTDLTSSHTIEERSQAIHEAIALHRFLLVIDDAWTVDAALAFRLGGPNCAHVVTTRLPEVAVHFAANGIIRVPELTKTEGLALLAELAPQVAQAAPQESNILVEKVGGLPLGLVLIGNALRIEAHQPTYDLQNILKRLNRAEERLGLSQPQGPLDRHPSLLPNEAASLTAVIQISEQALDEAARRTLRSLSVLPPKPNSFSLAAAAAVSSILETAAILDNLIAHGLLERADQERYALHQAIADYGRALLSDAIPYEQMVAFFVAYIQKHETDFDSLERELSNILAALETAVNRSLSALFVEGVNGLCNFFYTRGYYDLAAAHLQQAQEVAATLLDPDLQTKVEMNLGRLALNQGDYDQAESCFRSGLDLARQTAEVGLISRLLQGLAVTLDYRGNYQQALQHYQESLTYARQAGDKARQATLLMNLGGLSCDLDVYEQAQEYLEEGLSLARQVGHDGVLSPLLLNLGVVAGSLGNTAQEEQYYREALTIARQMGHQEDIAFLLTNLATLAADQGNFKEAEMLFQEGLAIAREIGHREREGALLRHLGELAVHRQSYEVAEAYLSESLALARSMGHGKNRVTALANLGWLHCRQGKLPEAENELQDALAQAQELGHQWHVCDATIKYGELHLARDNVELAKGLFQEALQMAREMSEKKLTAYALDYLSRAAVREGNNAETTAYNLESLAIFAQINHWKQFNQQ